ncbi:MAG TPA: class I SAM-dependent methyltransferase [Thermoanaerobaculia bacterium]|nr:class I SAM-dependent methyltransferase [Thermoanaerobaculia bacterium]HUM30834.1 class I SAM-dependent methyltransferase [Thermoanaerobaculia bacterium]HXK69185.1 class I SAM-dependent methyltransferase [Thermoanaerobaculia bacterium]
MKSSPPGLSGFLSGWVKRKRMVRALPLINPEDFVLDLGCGLGEIVPLLPEGVNYMGVDRDSYMVEHNREVYPGFSFLLSDLASDPFPEGPWTVILCLAVLEHLDDPLSFLKKCKPCMKEGGRVIITTPHPRTRLLHGWMSKMRLLSRHADEDHETFLHRPVLEKMAREAGYAVQEYTPFLMGMNQFIVLKNSTPKNSPD